jgi:hypothetical protein
MKIEGASAPSLSVEAGRRGLNKLCTCHAARTQTGWSPISSI